MFRRQTCLLEVVELGETFAYLVAIRYFGEIFLREGVLCLHPFQGGGGGVILQWPVFVGHFRAEVFIDHAVVGRRGGILDLLR